MAGVEKYNYNAALELLVNSYKSGSKVTYENMQLALGLEKPIEDKSATSTNNSALGQLRKRLRKEHNLLFRSACNGTHCGPEYQYYIVSEIKDSSIIKKEDRSIKKPDTKESNYEALSRDNQKLYAEVQQLKLKVQVLEAEKITYAGREAEYKAIISSLMTLANIT